MSGPQVIVHPAYGSERGWSAGRRRSRGLSLSGLALHQLRQQGAWTVAVALGLTLVVAVAAAVPLAGAMAADAALRTAISAPGPQVQVTVARQNVADQSGFEAFQARAGRQVVARLGRYLASSGALATMGPLTPISLNENPAPAQVDSSRLSVGYLRELAERVELVAGGVPPDGLGGSEDIAATMAQSEADALGLHLGDRLCLDFARGPRWCARVVGLWRPLAGDPFSLEAGRRVELVVGRFDFYRLMKLAPSPLATVGRQFYMDVDSIDNRNAGDLLNGLRELRRNFTGAGELFDTPLDVLIGRFDERQQPVRVASELLSSALAFLALYAIAFLAGQFAGYQSRELKLLGARGWPRRRVRRLLMLELAALAAVALAVGLGLTLVLAAGPGGALVGASPPWPDPSDRAGLVLAAGAVAGGLAAVWMLLSRLAARAARVEGPPPQPSRQGGGRVVGWLLFPAGLALLGGARVLQGLPAFLPGARPASSSTVDWLTVLLALLGALLLALAGERMLPRAGRLAERLSHGVPGSLAAWQLERRPQQHRSVAVLMSVAVAAATFGGLSAVVALRPGRELPPAVVLVAGAAGALAIALVCFGLHFRAAAARRAEEYATLLLSGLPGRALRRSLAVEQRAVTWQGLASGTLLGVGLALAVLPLPSLTADLAAASLVVSVVLLGFLAAVVVTGWAARGWLGRLYSGSHLQVQR
jgi:hypothetical protein